MSRVISTKTVARAKISSELNYLLSRLEQLGQQHCDVLFGFAWGNDYYPTQEWTYETLLLRDVEGKISDAEARGLGKLGSDDFFIRLPSLGVEFKLCHECDLHLEFERANELTEEFYQRWKMNGFNPSEWQRTEGVGPGDKLREN